MSMNLPTFLEFAKKYNDLGWAVQEQLADVALAGDPLEDQNLNALEMVANFLSEISSDVDGAGDLGDEIDAFIVARLGTDA